MRRGEDGWNGREAKRVDCLRDVRGFNRLDRRKAVEEGENRGILHAKRINSIVGKQFSGKTAPTNDQSKLYESHKFSIQISNQSTKNMKTAFTSQKQKQDEALC